MSASSPLSIAPRRTVELFGASIQLLTKAELTAIVMEAAASHSKCVVANHNLHSLYLLQRDPKLRDFFMRSEWTHVDGMPIIALARRLGFPAERRHRVTYVDWAPLLMQTAAETGLRVFYLGSRPTVADRGARILRAQFPALQIDTAHGFFDTARGSAENFAVLSQIRQFRPHILMVGMGMPRQEHWIHENLDQIEANVILPSGACIDYIAGEVPSPPRWMGKVGIEWLYRLATEPRRLASRYLIEPWSLLPLFVRDYMASKRER